MKEHKRKKKQFGSHRYVLTPFQLQSRLVQGFPKTQERKPKYDGVVCKCVKYFVLESWKPVQTV